MGRSDALSSTHFFTGESDPFSVSWESYLQGSDSVKSVINWAYIEYQEGNVAYTVW